MENAIFSRAWELAERRAKNASEREGRVYAGGRWRNGVVNEGVHKTARDYIATTMGDAVDECHDEAARREQEAQQDERANHAAERHVRNSHQGRDVELLSVAERDGLPHGRSWVCSGYDVDARGISPEREGEMVCYVYGD